MARSKSTHHVLWVVWAVALATAITAAARQGAPRPTEADCRLTITAVNGDSGAPLAGVTLRLMFVPPAAEAAAAQAEARKTGSTLLRETHSADTDARGIAVFEQLRAGRYNMVIGAPLGLAPPSAPRLFDLAEHQSAMLTVPLHVPGKIAGRVIADGKPVPGVQVMLMQWGGPAGGPAQLVGVNPASAAAAAAGASGPPVSPRQPPPLTGRDGRFGFGNLAPGDYYVVAAFADPRNPRPEFAPTYFPGVTLTKDARAVTVRAGQESPDAEISLVRVKPARVRVKAYDSRGEALRLGPLGHVSLMPVSEDRARPPMVGPTTTFSTGATSADFEAAPGEYCAVARLMTDRDPGTGERPSGRLSSGPTIWDAEVGYECVSVKDGGTSTVSVRTNAGAVISGRVIVEDGVGAERGAASLAEEFTVLARPEGYPRTPGAATMSAAVHDGSFSMSGVRGAVRLSVQGGGAVVKSIAQGGEDITAKALELKGTERITDILITATRATSRLEGVVLNAPAEGGMVIAFPEDRALWTAGNSRVHVARVLRSADGAGSAPFAFSSLLPGRYLVVALSDISPVAPIEPSSLERFRPQATPVALQARETKKVELRSRLSALGSRLRR